ncbi:MAG: fumarylacetoacetate hydrolase family protein [Maricaulaceae bacterium]|nr:fumarylacetoacetate hydrolase family protein [Maricaulaceae bacterium]
MKPLFPPPSPILVPIEGTDQGFPVRRILCAGKNYSDHVKEMGGDPAKTPPVFFTKPADAVVANGAAIPYPLATEDLHHEVELVVALKSGGRNLSEVQAEAAIFGAAAGVDLTRRDLQAAAKKAGAPWDAAKAFDDSAPLGAIRPGPAPATGAITLSVNGALRQNGDLSEMTHSVPALVAALSRLFELKAGDLVFTGTPAGVGPLNPGDRVSARVADLPPLDFSITEAAR